MKVSVVVPAYNEAKLIEGTLARIALACGALAARGWETETIVCDNNSTDATAQMARAAGARVVFEPINQIGRARNAGAAAATGQWLIFVDADSSPTPELFGDVADAIESGRCLGGGSTIRMDEAHFFASALTAWWNMVSRVTRWAAGAFMFCETAAFRQVGGFDPDLFASEELYLFKRLKRLARASRKKVMILHRHPMVTSARKMRLYSAGELLRFFTRAILRTRRTITSRDACSPWYDGRR